MAIGGWVKDRWKDGKAAASDLGSHTAHTKFAENLDFTGSIKGINNIGNAIDKKFISGDYDAKKAARDKQAAIDDGVNATMDESLKTQKTMSDEYKKVRNSGVNDMNQSDEGYEGRVRDLTAEAKNSATDASIVHTNMSNKYDRIQEDTEDEVRSAMTLGEYNNPNNRVSRSVRDIYNTEGDRVQGDYNAEGDNLRGQYNAEGVTQQGLYDQQATGETRRGQADFGVLSSLGAQSMGQGGMGPMTVGQQMAMMAQSQRQAGEAYAGAQRRVQGLRDQGLQANTMNRDRGLEQYANRRDQGLSSKTGLRERGVQAGFDRSDAAFAAGESARDRRLRVMQDKQGLENNYRTFQQGSRGEREGFSQNLNSSERGRAGRKINVASDDRSVGLELERARVAEAMRRAGVDEGRINAKLTSMQGDTAARQAVAGGVVSAAGSVVGGMYGGPAGAAAGSNAGKIVPQGGGSSGASQNPYAGPAPQQMSFAPPQQQQSPYDAAGGAFGQYLSRKYPARSTANA